MSLLLSWPLLAAHTILFNGLLDKRHQGLSWMCPLYGYIQALSGHLYTAIYWLYLGLSWVYMALNAISGPLLRISCILVYTCYNWAPHNGRSALLHCLYISGPLMMVGGHYYTWWQFEPPNGLWDQWTMRRLYSLKFFLYIWAPHFRRQTSLH